MQHTEWQSTTAWNLKECWSYCSQAYCQNYKYWSYHAIGSTGKMFLLYVFFSFLLSNIFHFLFVFFLNIILLCLVNPWKFDCLFFIYFRSALITLLSQHQLHLLLLFGFHRVEQCSSHQKRHSLSKTTWPLLLNLASIWKVTWQRIIQRLDGLEEIF